MPMKKGLYYVFGLLLVFRTGDSFNCDVECFGTYQPGQTSCTDLIIAIDCFQEHSCSLNFKYLEATTALQECGNTSSVIVASTTEEPAPTHEPLPCPSLPPIDDNISVDMPRPSVEPPAILPLACLAPASFTGTYRQCSLFMDSQLRAFSDYRQGLETCSIPGKWYLLRHHSLSVEVEGTNLTNLGSGATHTRLSKISVTVGPSSCDQVSRSYVAQGSLPLPAHFSPPVKESNDSTARSSQPLQLVCDSNGTVVTLLLSWLNTAIVIRQYAGFLSVTIQVPRQIAMESEGLCMGCPSQMYINITRFNSEIPSTCSDAKSKAMIGCFVYGGVVNRDHLLDVTNNTYLDVCLYSMYKTRTVAVLAMLHAITEDAKPISNLMSTPQPSTSSLPSSLPSSFPQTDLRSRTDQPDINITSHSMMLHSFPKLLALLCCLLFLLLR